MGYTLKIGKKEIDQEYKKDIYADCLDDGLTPEEADRQSSMLAVNVVDEEFKDAPAFGEPTDFTNGRWPSYSSWSLFTRLTETGFLFYEESGEFKGGHPGHFSITKEWLSDLKHFAQRFRDRYPDSIASFDETVDSHNITIEYIDNYDKTVNHVPANYMLCRLEWLEYWAEYALDKYGSEAVFYNS
jgi:hypothetical protein